MEKPKIFIEIYGGLVNRIVSSIDAEISVLTDNSKAKSFEDLGKWEPVILVRNDEEFRHIARKIINKEI